MESAGHIAVPLRGGGKKMRKRRELDALVAHSSRGSSVGNRSGNGINSHDQLLSQSTDEQDEYVWTKSHSSSRARANRISFLRSCGPFLLITSMLLSLGFVYWLYFDIRSQITDYRLRIEQVSATSQHVPEALQKWHETSKALEQNQTTLSEHILEIQKALKAVNLQMTQLTETVDQKNANSQENQILSLQNNIATFGSQITAFTGQIDKLTSDYAELKEHQKHFNETVLEIRKNFEATKNLTLPSTVADNATREKLDTFIKSIEDRFNNLSLIVSSENETLLTSLKWFEDDLKNKTVKLNELSDNYLNISSHVYSVENLYTTNLSKQFESLQTTSSTLNATVGKQEQLFKSQFESLEQQIKEIQKRLDETVAASAKIETVVKPQKDDQLEKIFSLSHETNMPPMTQNSKSSNSNNIINTKNNEPVIPSSGSQKQSSDNIDKHKISTNLNEKTVKTEPSTTNAGVPTNNNSTFPAGLMQN